MLADKGFQKLSEEVYLRPSQSEGVKSIEGDPATVIIYGWGDANPKHLAKYIEGYQKLFPQARLVVIFSSMLKIMQNSLEQRSEKMVPVIDAVFGDKGGRNTEHGGILIHAMSNMGGMSLASTLHAYQRLSTAPESSPMPHTLLVLDSTPGSTHFLSNIGPWSRAMAIALKPPFPWPTLFTQALAALFLGLIHGLGWLLGRTSAAEFSVKAVNDSQFASKDAARLYLFSEADEIISWKDIVQHAAEAREQGYDVETEVFDGTPHVGHMREHPEQYWQAIERRWRRANGDSRG
ncbi:Transmembrane protein 53 [Pleurostoma richardsiae]|uniref:Transmembrane protein 53 n=1 Tax=Pleurostoma richardsiae TaxID=41990 RepID=A0AA38R5V5_9PEZI|nr:Transmembrane protein 53 [Pleurostoma richardsiae]